MHSCDERLRHLIHLWPRCPIRPRRCRGEFLAGPRGGLQQEGGGHLGGLNRRDGGYLPGFVHSARCTFANQYPSMQTGIDWDLMAAGCNGYRWCFLVRTPFLRDSGASRQTGQNLLPYAYGEPPYAYRQGLLRIRIWGGVPVRIMKLCHTGINIYVGNHTGKF